MACCNCNCDPCRCVPAAGCCPETETLTYTFENQNIIGIGVFDNETNLLVGFRGIVSLTNSVIVALDAANKAITLDFDIDLFVDDLPDATTTQRGVLETATDAEAIAKAATDKILTPSNLAAIGASATFAGLIEIATNAEAITGTSDVLAVTPASLAAVNATFKHTVTFADAVARAALVPQFDGQFGFQIDVNTPYFAYGVGAGDWAAIFAFGTTPVVDSLTTTVDLTSGSDMNFDSSDSTGFIRFQSGLEVTFQSGSFLDLNGTLQIGNVTIPANSVMITSAVAGTPSSKLLNTFVSTSNTNTGWTAFTNSAVLKTADCNTVTLPQLAQIVDTLIGALRNVLLPAV